MKTKDARELRNKIDPYLNDLDCIASAMDVIGNHSLAERIYENVNSIERKLEEYEEAVEEANKNEYQGVVDSAYSILSELAKGVAGESTPEEVRRHTKVKKDGY